MIDGATPAADDPPRDPAAGACRGVVTAGIYIFITSWNEYLFAMMLSGQTVRTVTVALQLFIGEFTVQWGLLTAGGTLIALPVDPSLPPRSTTARGRSHGRRGEIMTMTNPIGVISMFYARPFTREHFSTFARMKAAGADVVELLVPEPGELDLAETRRAVADAGLSHRARGPREPDARSRQRRTRRRTRPASPI